MDSLRAYVEGRPAAARAVCAPEADAELDVPLQHGVNRVTVAAFDARGAASNLAAADVTSASAARPELWLVAAGVSRYPKLPDEYQLALAADDAKAVFDAFSAQAGPDKLFSAVHGEPLLDERVTVEALDAALAELAKMKADDVAVVFLAGHGFKPSADADMVFITAAADATEAGVRAGGLGWSAIARRLAAVKGRVVLLLDACHSGHVSQDRLVPNDDLARALVREHRAGVLVFAASKGRQFSYEPSGTRALVLKGAARPLVTRPAGDAHGFFAGGLLASLAARDTDGDGDGVIELSELVDDVSARVSLASDGKQTPWVARREMFGDFALARPP